MLKDRRPLLTTFADKVAVREYVANVVGADCLTDSYAVAADPREIDRRALPREFVAKVSHGCGGMWIVTDTPGMAAPDPDSKTVIATPEALDWARFETLFKEWLRRPTDYVEWAYRKIPPRILVEELLSGPDGKVPNDYKIYVFNGRARLLHVDIDRFTEHRRRVYLPDWTPLDVAYIFPSDPTPSPPPASLSRMIEVAEALGAETDFVRVDLYDVDGRVVVGELTNYPGAGTGNFTPLAFEHELGSWWTLPPSYSSRYFQTAAGAAGAAGNRG
jgi:hypothetical protein